MVLGAICILFGVFGWLGQVISGLNYPLAQKLGLQEKDEGTDPLFRRAEANTARWDALVLWTLPVAGILLLLGHPWWPWVSLLAGGIYLDAAGREAAKFVSLKKGGVRIGTARDRRMAAIFFAAMAAVAVWLSAYALCFLAARPG